MLDFWRLNQLCILEIDNTWSRCIMFCIHFWNLVWDIFLYVHDSYCTLLENFLKYICLVFVSDNVSLVEWIRKYFLFFEYSRMLCAEFYSWWNLPVKPPRPGVSFLERFVTTNSISSIHTGYLFLLEWAFVVCVFQGTCPFHLSF